MFVVYLAAMNSRLSRQTYFSPKTVTSNMWNIEIKPSVNTHMFGLGFVNMCQNLLEIICPSVGYFRASLLCMLNKEQLSWIPEIHNKCVSTKRNKSAYQRYTRGRYLADITLFCMHNQEQRSFIPEIHNKYVSTRNTQQVCIHQRYTTNMYEPEIHKTSMHA